MSSTHCSDTDVLLLLMDLVANNIHGAMTKINFIKIGKVKGAIYINERVKAVGQPKAMGLFRIHNFTWVDWGGKFVGTTKKKWINAYLELPDDEVIDTFQ